MSVDSAMPLPSPHGLASARKNEAAAARYCLVKTRKVKHRAATALRVGAKFLCHAMGYSGEFFRRMRAKLGTAQGITATAHKIARILYQLSGPVKNGAISAGVGRNQ